MPHSKILPAEDTILLRMTPGYWFLATEISARCFYAGPMRDLRDLLNSMAERGLIRREACRRSYRYALPEEENNAK